jgi:hypothetical protein
VSHGERRRNPATSYANTTISEIGYAGDVRATWIVALVAASACWRTTPTTSVDPPPPPPQTGPTPEARARQIVEAQIDADSSVVYTTLDQRYAAVRATFAPDAVVLLENGARRASEIDSGWFHDVAVATLVADGDADIVWFTVTFRDVASEGSRNPNSVEGWPPVRYAGVAARSAGWKVVAASVVMLGSTEASGSGQVHHDSFPNATTSAVLAPLVLDGPSLARAMPTKAMVMGLGTPPPVAFGPQALGVWETRHLVLDPDAREIVTPSWATLQAQAAFSNADDRGNLGIFAIARRERGAWQPVFVQYIGQ